MLLSMLLMPQMAMAGGFESLGLTGTERGIYCVLIFIIAYGFVMTEEFTHMRKSNRLFLRRVSSGLTRLF